MRALIALLLAAALAAVLYLTNPDSDAFARRFAEEVNAEIARELGVEGQLGILLSGATRGLVEEAVRQRTRRDDYLLASIFTLPLPGEDVRALGIAGQFIFFNRER
jgi:hypothetical protein